mmetsp:Transcript_34403/g.135265  ORF Transcript_34403/g.135265 Transcript_34403/m.135265 type:complete len:99 (+) Transcript_34403:400-696(+)
MSSEDIEEALEEVRSQLDGKMLEFLRKRKEQKAEKTRKSSDKGLENLPGTLLDQLLATRRVHHIISVVIARTLNSLYDRMRGYVPGQPETRRGGVQAH